MPARIDTRAKRDKIIQSTPFIAQKVEDVFGFAQDGRVFLKDLLTCILSG